VADEQNVWKLIYSEDAARKAQNLIASAFRADDEPGVLLAEIEKVSTWLVDGDSDEIGQKVVYLVSALTMLARMSLDQFATVVESARLSVDEHLEPDPTAVRNTAFDLLSEYAANLRLIADK